MSDEERDNADNLMLICDDEHSEIDKWGSRDAFTVPFLRELKRKHEDQVFLATSFGEYNRTTPIRMVGWLRGSPAEVGRDAVATAVMASAGRMPRFDLSTRNMLEIDLRGLPGEDGPLPVYYVAACQVIDRAVKTKAAEAVASDDIIHLSVFAFARLPLLVYLGAQLGDQVPVDVYQKHRRTGDWKWPEPDGKATFAFSVPDPEPARCEATLVINVSGTIHRDELPPDVRDLPVFELAVDQLAHPDVLAGPGALDAFSDACRRMLAEMEGRGHKHVRLLHVFAAMPLSSAVEFGRVLSRDVYPSLQLYDRTPSGDYVPAIQVGK
ncbi:MAG: SAVED domain-containing protein [Arthrobacter sp.]|nr:SAVED domain-containing protein [Arthrobacter sp.]